MYQFHVQPHRMLSGAYLLSIAVFLVDSLLQILQLKLEKQYLYYRIDISQSFWCYGYKVFRFGVLLQPVTYESICKISYLKPQCQILFLAQQRSSPLSANK